MKRVFLAFLLTLAFVSSQNAGIKLNASNRNGKQLNYNINSQEVTFNGVYRIERPSQKSPNATLVWFFKNYMKFKNKCNKFSG